MIMCAKFDGRPINKCTRGARCHCLNEQSGNSEELGKPTLGEWFVTDDGNTVAARGARFTRTATYGEYSSELITNQRGEFHNPNDAVLVAAAKDMLKVLKWVNDNPDDSAYWTEQVKAAIAKATGAP